MSTTGKCDNKLNFLYDWIQFLVEKHKDKEEAGQELQEKPKKDKEEAGQAIGDIEEQ